MAFPLLLIILLLSVIWLLYKKPTFSNLSTLSTLYYIVSAFQAFILSLQVGYSAHLIFQAFPQKYPDLIVGGLGFLDHNKSAELNAIYLAIFFFAILFFLILSSYGSSSDNKDYRAGILKIAIYGLIPAFLMFGQSLRMSSTKYLLLLAYSLVTLSVFTILILKYLFNHKYIKPEDTLNTGIKLILIPVFLGLSEFGLNTFLTRTGLFDYKFGVLTLIFGLIYLVFSIIKRRTADFISWLNFGVFIGQLSIPFLFFTLFTPPIRLTDGTLTLFSSQPVLLIIILCLLLISIIDITKRYKKEEKRSDSTLHIISPWALVAVLILLQARPIQWPGIALDEYHWGEMYSPWWLLEKFNYLPFVDFNPARGLVNYVPGFLTWSFYDNTFASQNLIYNQFTALYVFFAFFAFRIVVGDFIAFLMVSSLSNFTGAPTGGLIITVASLAIIYKSILGKNYVKSFWIWVGLSIFSSLFYIAEGTLFVIGTLPLALWLLYKSFNQNKKQFLISVGVFSLAATIVILATNIGKILLGAVRYLIEQASINEVAHGIALKFPLSDINQAVTSGYLWQIIRFSWILLIIPIFILLIRNQLTNNKIENQFILIALLISSIYIIPRAAGRIDPVAFSRPALTSIGLIICGLPLVTLTNIRKSSLLLVFPLLFSFIFGLLGNQESQLQNARKIPGQIIAEPPNTVNGASLGFPAIGNAITIDQNQLKRQIELKTVLDQILDPNETFFDATNHSVDYGFQGRPSPVSDIAPYNAPSPVQQKRIVEQLEEKQVPVALIQAENILHDGGSLSLRNYTICAYLLKEYIPFVDDFGRIWMVRSGQEDRLRGTNYRVGNEMEQIELLSQAFWQKNLAGIPSAWGNSISSLSDELSDGQNVFSKAKILETNDLELVYKESWQVVGENASISFELPQSVDGDLLFIEFNHEVKNGNFQIFWTDENNPNFDEENSFIFSGLSGKYLIPLSAAPSWAKSNHITMIRIDFPGGTANDIRLEKVYLYKRY